MANADRPNGFRPVKYLSGACYTGAFNKYFSVNDNLFMGDIVEKEATGTASGSGGYPGCDRMDNGATDVPLGVVVGWDKDPAALDRLYHASSATIAVHICDDPNVVMEAQTDDAGIAVTDIGLNVDVTIAAGTTASGLSNMEISGTSEVTTAATPLKLIQGVDKPDNDLTLANSKWLVMFNLHAYKSDAGTAGI